jgi:hypothetical protein
MSLIEIIEDAFINRTIPNETLNVPHGRDCFDSDERDALWFLNREWHDITAQDWAAHYAALTFFTAEALAYYLPSIMITALKFPNEPLIAAENLIDLLFVEDTQLFGVDGRKSRFSMLHRGELDALGAWLEFSQGPRKSADIDSALRLISRLKKEAQ